MSTAENVMRDGRPDFAALAVSAILAVKLLLMLAVINRYGYFRDELYYLSCSEHLAWGYVDQPPLVAAITWAVRHTLGTSLFALRLLPALTGCASILLAALMAREMGGRRMAQVIAALGVFGSMIFFGLDHLLTMSSFARPWIWIGGALAGLIASPNFLWQMHRGFPFLELMHNIRMHGRDVSFGPLGFLWQQFFMLNPLCAPAVILGVAWFFTSRGKPYRVLGWSYLFTLVIMIVLKGKNYYLAPIYPMIFGAAGVALEQFAIARKTRPWRMRLVDAYVALWMISSVLLMPLALPVLSVDHYIAYTQALHLAPPKRENQAEGRLPQIYADMHGWPEVARTTANYYNSLPADERVKTAIFTGNYGDAGSIDFFGTQFGLPKAISGHQSFWFWGPRDYTGESVILLGEDDPPMVAETLRIIHSSR